ncbi:hypothetical protein VE03_10570 [Pseudogymnoascus sp. 23342-1-I1]|nr:hypothetical protein VE03_10570 [Pseudogymnoascus sp. 23342-1-I1]
MSYYGANNKEDIEGSCLPIIASSNAFSDGEVSPPAEPTVPTIPTEQLSLDDDQGRFRFYTECLEGIRHRGCNVLGEAWAKTLQLWWPVGSDQMDNHGRSYQKNHIPLLIHILNKVEDQSSDKPKYLQAITVEELEKVTKQAMSVWFKNIDKSINDKSISLRNVSNIFRVAKLHERHRRGELDGTATISICSSVYINPNVSDEDYARSFFQLGPSLPPAILNGGENAGGPLNTKFIGI